MCYKYTFEQDQLNRKPIAECIEKYLHLIQENNPQQAVSFAINARWGEGKTYFIGMWKHLIEENTRDVAIYYNAWENDDCDSAILPLLYNIISVVKDAESETFIKHAKFFLKTLGMHTLKLGVGKFLCGYEEIADILTRSIDDVNSADIRTFFLEYDEYYGRRKKLQEGLQELIPEDGNLWVFIDDLDRCNPMFAINTLECIKHFFNIAHIRFIFAIDYNHLSMAAEQVYGKDVDSTSYMKKFFDVIYQLPSPDRCKYVEYKIKSIQNRNVREIIRKANFKFYFKKFDFSLRDIDLTMTHMELLIKEHFDEFAEYEDRDVALNVYLYFMCIKDKFNREYMDIIHGRFLMDSSCNGTWKVLDKKFLIKTEINKLLEAISNGVAERCTTDIIQRYSLLNLPAIDKFSDHMEYMLR